jgi:hypothetical protein
VTRDGVWIGNRIYSTLKQRMTIYLSIYLWFYSPFVGPWLFFSVLILYRVGRTPWTGDQPIARPLRTHRTTQTQNTRTQTSMQPTSPAFERAKAVHALDPAATVIGKQHVTTIYISLSHIELCSQSRSSLIGSSFQRGPFPNCPRPQLLQLSVPQIFYE